MCCPSSVPRPSPLVPRRLPCPGSWKRNESLLRPTLPSYFSWPSSRPAAAPLSMRTLARSVGQAIKKMLSGPCVCFIKRIWTRLKPTSHPACVRQVRLFNMSSVSTLTSAPWNFPEWFLFRVTLAQSYGNQNGGGSCVCCIT